MSARASRRGNATDRAEAKRRREITADVEKTEAHLEHLRRQHAEMEQGLRANEVAQQQMLGRLRKNQEDLGLVEPLADPPAPPPEEDEPSE